MFSELRQLAVFTAVARAGSFRGASDALGLSPSVVSHHIAQLEEKLGVSLIYRSTRRLTLTNHGERLLADAGPSLDKIDRTISELRGVSSVPSGQLRVTLPSVLAHSPLIRLIAEFNARYPKIVVDLDFTDTRQNLIEGNYDVAIRMATKRARAPNRKSLFMSRRIIVASRSFAQSDGEFDHPSKLSSHHWIDFTPSRVAKIEIMRNGKSQVLSTHSSISTNEIVAAYKLVLAGAGIAIVPDFLAQRDIEAGETVQLLPDWNIQQLEAFAEWPISTRREGILGLFVDAIAAI